MPKKMTAETEQMKRIIVICLLISLIPLGTIGAGVYWTLKRHAVFATYQKTTGEILKLDTKKENQFDVGGQVSYYPHIVYSDDSSEAHVLVSKVGSNPPIGRVGQRLDLLFNPRNPEDAVIDSFFFKWFGPTVVLVLGFVLLALVSVVSVILVANEHKGRKT